MISNIHVCDYKNKANIMRIKPFKCPQSPYLEDKANETD